MKKTILALLVFTLVFASCKKDNKNEAVTPTKENLTGTYKMTAGTMTSGGATVDVFNNDTYTPACQRDDLYKLNADNSYVIQDAGVVCSPSDDDSGTWSLLSATSIDLNGDVGTIKSWNGKTLVVEGTYQNITVSATYVKQ